MLQMRRIVTYDAVCVVSTPAEMLARATRNGARRICAERT
jgi:hypothetical protein